MTGGTTTSWRRTSWPTRATPTRYRGFYRDAREAAGLPDKSALEVFYLCAALGFRGLYRDTETVESQIARESLQLPPTLEGWMEQAYAGIRLSSPPEIDGQGEPIDGVYPLEGPGLLIWASCFALILLVLAAAVIYLAVPTS